MSYPLARSCIKAYVKMAHDKGASQNELIEFLEVAMTMQGCPGEEWALKAYAVYRERVDHGSSPDTSGCCDHQPMRQDDEKVTG
jgi:hypothetical protein